MFHRTESTSARPIDRWEDGVGWFAHPNETGQRASHAVRDDAGDVWVFDPVDAPGVDDLLAELGDVVGVAVLSSYHARDAGAVATRHDVPVHVPAWLDRVAEHVDAPIERYRSTLGDSGFRIRSCSPVPGYREAVAYRESDDTLYAPDVLGTAPMYTAGDERLAVYLFFRLAPPADALGNVAPERILVGHGTGVFDDATAALSTALDSSRRRFPRAVVENGRTQLRALASALG